MANENRQQVVTPKNMADMALMEYLKKYSETYGNDEMAKVLFVAIGGIIQGQLPGPEMLNNALPMGNVANMMGMLGGNIGNVRQLVNSRQRQGQQRQRQLP